MASAPRETLGEQLAHGDGHRMSVLVKHYVRPRTISSRVPFPPL